LQGVLIATDNQEKAFLDLFKFQEHSHMGGIINFFKNLIGGIVGFIGGLLGGKKQGDFFLELDETQSPEAAPAAIAAVAAVATPEAAAVGTPEAPAAAPKATKNAKKGSQAPAAPAPGAISVPKPTVTFAEASKAAPVPTPRRRPGANMGAYIDMAKTINRA
jgi:hypothetical protein